MILRTPEVEEIVDALLRGIMSRGNAIAWLKKREEEAAVRTMPEPQEGQG